MWKLFNSKVFLLLILGSISIVIGLESLTNAHKSLADTSSEKDHLVSSKVVPLGTSPLACSESTARV